MKNFMLWREYYALRRYLNKHLAANPPIDREWYEAEISAIARLTYNDYRPNREEGTALEEQYEMIWGKEPWPRR